MVNITVFGVGKLGLCFALQCEKNGHDVLGVDVVESYVHNLNQKSFLSDEPGVTEALVASKHFRVSLSIDEGVAHSNYLFLFLPTPTGTGEKSYDHSMLSGFLQQLVWRNLLSLCCSYLCSRMIVKLGLSTLLYVALYCPDTTKSLVL
jgi:UDP-glucose 6-dehydrogenase